MCAAQTPARHLRESFRRTVSIPRPTHTHTCRLICIPRSPLFIIVKETNHIVGFATALLFAAGSVAGETIFDFADPASAFILESGKYVEPAEAAKQLEAKTDGLHVHLDAAKMKPAPPWCTLTVPDRLSKARPWLGQGVVLVMRKDPFRRVTKAMAVNLTDRDGETFQFLPRKIKTNLADGTVSCSFAFTEAGHGRPWGGGTKANGRMDAPVRLTAINAHYSHDSGEGEVVFVRLEEEAQAAKVARPVRSVEPISVDTTYPGAAPFPGAKALTFTVSPAFRGTATLVLSYDSSGNAMQGAMTNLTASTTDGTLRFPCDLPRLSQFQFVGLEFKPSAESPKGPWKIVRAEGTFEQTSAEAFRLDVETGNFLHVVRAEKASERPVVTIRNPAETPQTWGTTLRFADVFDRRFEIPFDRTLAPGETVRIPVPWPLPAKGMWYLTADVRGADGSTMAHESRFAFIDLHERTPIVDGPKFRFGIHYHGIRYLPDLVGPTIDALVAAGAKFTRTDYGFMFGDVMPHPDVTDWSKADDLLRRLRNAGLSLDIIVQSTPGWAVDPEILKARQSVRRTGCLPSRPGLLRDFCHAIAARYGTQIDYYEIGNEWDLVTTNTLTHAEAVRMQREAMEGVHAGCPAACVTPNGWASSTTSGTVDWSRTNPGLIERFAEEPDLYDVWALHCHGSFDSYVKSLQEKFFPLRERTGMKNKPWTSHETAMTSFGDAELDVARTVWAKTLYAWSWGSRDYIWYNLRATGWLEGGEPGYGLITAGFRPRAGYAAYAALTAIFQGLDADGRLIARHPLHLYRFKGGKDGFRGIVLAGWDWGAETPHGVRVRTDAARASISDHMGNRSAVTIKDGVIELPLDLNPKALLLDSATTAILAD